AVMSGEQKLSYRQLYDKSCDLALHLQSIGVKPDSVVGLCVESSLDLMVGIVGTLQSGGACLPLNPADADDRLAYMLQDSQAMVVLTQEKFKYKIGSLLARDARVITLDAPRSALNAQGIALRQDARPHNLAWVIYPAGSA